MSRSPASNSAIRATPRPISIRARRRWRPMAMTGIELSFTIRSRRAPWTRTTSAICAARTARRRCAAEKAGFDLIYVYAGHGLGIFQQFLSRATNQRTDEYGGSLENRARLLREVIEETKDAVGDICAVPVRIAMNEFLGPRRPRARRGRRCHRHDGRAARSLGPVACRAGPRTRRPRAFPRKDSRSPISRA